MTFNMAAIYPGPQVGYLDQAPGFWVKLKSHNAMGESHVAPSIILLFRNGF